MSERKELSTTVVEMTTAEAQAAHEALGKTLARAGREMAAILLDIRDRKGYKRLGFDSFGDYIKRKVEADFGGRSSVYRWMDLIEVERALHDVTGKELHLPLRHAVALAPLVETPELVAEAYKESGGDEVILKVIVERLRPKPKTKAQKDKGGEPWTKEDLEDDKELRDVLDKIEHVYGKEERMAIQNGIIGLPRKEVIALAKLDAPTMEKIRHLILGNRWGVAESVAFANDMATEKSTVEELINWCLTSESLKWDAMFHGFKITVEATTAVKREILINRSAKHPGSGGSLQSGGGASTET